MKKIKLTQGKFALVDDKDFDWLSQWRWITNTNGYAARGQWDKGDKKEKIILMHRLILQTPANFESDHINQNKLDNRRINLRVATRSNNRRNCKLFRTNTSGFRGVYWDKLNKKWRAQISFNDKVLTLGRFMNKEDAARAYDNKAKEYSGEYAQLNFYK